MYASNYFENQVLNLMRNQPASGYSQLYLALFLSNPGDTGTEGTEISYSAYARQPISFSAPAASGSGLTIHRRWAQLNKNEREGEWEHDGIWFEEYFA